MQNNHRLLAVVCAILADASHEKLLDAGLVMLGHDYSWGVQVLCPCTNYLTNRVFVCVEVCDLNLVRNLGSFHLADKPPLNEAFCFADLFAQHEC